MNPGSTTLPVRAAAPQTPVPAASRLLPRRTWRRRLRGHYHWIVLCGLLSILAGGAVGWVCGDWLHHRRLIQLTEARRQHDQAQQYLQTLDAQLTTAQEPANGEPLSVLVTAGIDELRRIEQALSDTRIAHATAIPVETAEPGQGLSPSYLNRLARADADLRHLLDQRTAIERRLETLRRRMGPSAQQVIAATNELAQLDDHIQRHVVASRAVTPQGDAESRLPLTADELSARQQRLTVLRDQVQQRLARLRQAEAQISALAPQREETQQRLVAARQRIDHLSANASEADQLDRARLIGAALGAGLGLFPGLACVPLITLLRDGRIRRPDAVELGDPTAPLFGTIPTLPTDEMATAASDLTALSIHEIRALMQIRAERDGARAFAITSPSRGAGKTSLTVGLASSLALSGTRTLLVDCDLAGKSANARAATSKEARPKAASPDTTKQNLDQVMLQMGYLDGADPEVFLLSHDTRVGITGVLEGEPLEHCVIETSVPGLCILPALAATPQHIGRMSTRFVRRLIDEARDAYDMIIFDTGPIPGSVEALVVTSAADATILVVPRGERRSQLERAVSHLRVAGATLAGTVFNRAAQEDLTVQNDERTEKVKRDPADAADLRRSQTVRNITGSGILAAAVHTQASSAIPGPSPSRKGRAETERSRTPPSQRPADTEDASLADAGDIASILHDDTAQPPASGEVDTPPRSGGWRAAAAIPATRPDAPRTTDPELESALDELVNDARSAPTRRQA